MVLRIVVSNGIGRREKSHSKDSFFGEVEIKMYYDLKCTCGQGKVEKYITFEQQIFRSLFRVLLNDSTSRSRLKYLWGYPVNEEIWLYMKEVCIDMIWWSYHIS